MTADAIETTILQTLHETAAECGGSVAPTIDRATPVFATGLDSLGFAILVARLEDALGFDPFVALAEAVYPHTVGEFIDIYSRHQQRHPRRNPALV